jgi:hypothetical protein
MVMTDGITTIMYRSGHKAHLSSNPVSPIGNGLTDIQHISFQLQQMFTQLVTSFHERKFIHGDLGGGNRLVCHNETGELSMKLVNFDWGVWRVQCGVRSPSTVSTSTIQRAQSMVQ